MSHHDVYFSSQHQILSLVRMIVYTSAVPSVEHYNFVTIRLKLGLVLQLFSGLSQQGTFILFTSNKAPAELYKNGLNRQYFLPFVKLIQKQLAVVEVSSHSSA